MQLVLLGPPGSGKGTLAIDLIRIYKIVHISTGEIFRQNIKDNTPLGRDANLYIKNGDLVPDSITIAMVKERLSQPDCSGGFMLDGFPRTVPQAEALALMLDEKGQPLTAVLNIMVSDETVLERLSGRRLCAGCGRGYNIRSIPSRVEGICDVCGGKLVQRDDDRPETIRQRLANYNRQTSPLISYYKACGLLIDVDNEGEVGSSLNFVCQVLDDCLAGGSC